MNPGKFDKRIAIQRFESGTNENGFPIEEWIDLKRMWAMVKTLKSKEYYQAAAIQAENTTRFVIRYTTGVTSDMRILYKNRVFEIIAPPINDDESNETLTIMCREVL